MEDTRIVDLFLSRDEIAIKYTAEKYGKKLRGLARNICGDEGQAEECENDTYMKAWESIPPHAPRNYLLAFLSKITRSLALDCVKRTYRKKRNAIVIELSREIEESVGSIIGVESEIEASLLRIAINNFLMEQTQEKRNVFIRRYWYMDSIEGIATRYSMSSGKVKTILFRVRSNLKEYLMKEGFII